MMQTNQIFSASEENTNIFGGQPTTNKYHGFTNTMAFPQIEVFSFY